MPTERRKDGGDECGAVWVFAFLDVRCRLYPKSTYLSPSVWASPLRETEYCRMGHPKISPPFPPIHYAHSPARTSVPSPPARRPVLWPPEEWAPARSFFSGGWSGVKEEWAGRSKRHRFLIPTHERTNVVAFRWVRRAAFCQNGSAIGFRLLVLANEY